MPFRNEWFEPSKNLSLDVHKELPKGVQETKWGMGNLKEASGYVGEDYKQFHFCPKCAGWIEGHASRYEENTLNSSQLAGRQGTTYHCLRCGYEIDFFGRMS